MRRFDSNTEKKIIELYLTGFSPKSIGKECGIGNTTIYRILKRNKIKPKVGALKEKAPPFKICKHCSGQYKMVFGYGFKQYIESKYCSKKCFSASLKGIKRGIIPKSAFKKGQSPWNKGEIWEAMSGANNPNYKSKIKRKCPSCEKEFFVHPYRLAKPKNIYCSHACTVQGQYDNKVHRNQFTKPVRIIKEKLEKLGYVEGADFLRELRLGKSRYRFDFAFPAKKMLIEIQGDYWHANPTKYILMHDKDGKLIESGLTKAQIKAIPRDKQKAEFAREKGWSLLQFWEWDIQHDGNLKVLINAIKYNLSQSTN